MTADAKLGAALSARGTEAKDADSGKKTAEALDKLSKSSDETLKILKDIKNNTAATAIKKEK